MYLLFVLFMLLYYQANAEYGVLKVMQQSNATKEFCILYNPDFNVLSADQSQEPWHHLADKTPSLLCDKGDIKDLAESVVIASRGGCLFSDKALNVQNLNGSALLIANDSTATPIANASGYQVINITVGMMRDRDHYKISLMKGNLQAKLYKFSLPTPEVDLNLIVIWLIAMSTIIVGAYWSGHTKYDEILLKQAKQSETRERGSEIPVSTNTPSDSTEGQKKDSEDDDGETMDISVKCIIILVVFMCGVLVAMYYFYKYIVYVFIALFCIASCAGLYACLLPGYIRICRLQYSIKCKSNICEIRRLVLAVLCMSFAVWWGIERNTSYAWILQNILGIAFSINLLKTLRLPHLMGCTIMLALLLCYDVFFVFISPKLTKNGESIMVDVATGHGSGSSSSTGTGGTLSGGGASTVIEQIPMVYKVPKFSHSPVTVCPVISMNYSLLGFGDVIVPGFLLSYCHAFDLFYKTKRIYFILTSIAYGIGLIITFMVLIVMKSGQPALLYLVPCTLITVTVTGLCRGELRKLWNGFPKPKKNTEARPINSESSADTHTFTACNTRNPVSPDTHNIVNNTNLKQGDETDSSCDDKDHLLK